MPCAHGLCESIHHIAFSLSHKTFPKDPLQKTSLNLLTGSFRLIVRSLNGFPRQSAVARVRPLTVSHILDKRCDLHNRRWGCPRDLGVALIQDLFNGLFSHPRFDLGIGAPL